MKKIIYIIIIILIELVSINFAQNDFRSGLFLHHSTGGIIWGSSSPNVPQLMNMYNIENNYTGNNAVTMNIGQNFFPPLRPFSDHYWDSWHAVFNGTSPYPEDVDSLQSYIADNPIVVIKTGWGGTSIAPMGNPADTLIIDDEALGSGGRTYYRTQWHWRSIIRIMQNYPNNFFVIWTGIPLLPGPGYNGTIAHNFVKWAKDTLATGNDPIFGDFPDNVYVFDSFHLLADSANQNWGINSLYHEPNDNHPNEAGANVVAHPFVWETFDAAITYESITSGTTFQLTIPIQNGWNMISVPGLHPTNQNVSTWWPNRNLLADVFRWTTTYVPVTLTAPTQGYWMLHTGAQTYNTGDEWPAGGIQIVPHDPIPLTTGWNMIGGYENSPHVSGLTTTPTGLIVAGTVYGWTGTYTNATNLVPGYGYWILSTGNGVINPPTLSAGPSKLAVQEDKSEWGKITITDASDKSFTLYSTDGEVNLDQYQMPPLPPTGMFDVRYDSNRKAENLKENNQTIEMRGMVYPVTVIVENMGIRLEDETGRLVSERLKSGEEYKITNSAISNLKVSEDIIPDVYSLEQNYPNPFNPSTKIEFSIPEDVNNVTLTIYNALGQRVTELVNSKMEAGKYSYVWNASDVATGLYIYELRTNKFVSVKKMMLMK